MPLISTVITTRNRASLLVQAIESVLAQDFPAHEIIVVDDDSTDDTPQVVAGYPSVRYVRTKQGTCGGSRNVGIQQATGEWIALLDDDDAWLPQKLRRCVEIMAANPAARLIFSPAQLCDEQLRPGMGEPGCWEGPDLAGHSSAYEAFLDDIPSPSAVLLHREVFDAVGLFDTSVPHAEDRDLWFRVTGRGFACAAVPECLILYRVRERENPRVVERCYRDTMTVFGRYFAPGQPMLPSWKRRQQVVWATRGWYAHLLMRVARQEERAGRSAAGRHCRHLAAQASLPHYLKALLQN